MKIIFAFTILFATSVGGCMNECSWHAEKKWTDETLYPRFPPVGEYAGYRVSKSGPPQVAQRIAEASSTSGRYTGLTAYEDGDVAWQSSFSSNDGDGAASAKLNETLQAIGLLPARVPDWHFSWSQNSGYCSQG